MLRSVHLWADALTTASWARLSSVGMGGRSRGWGKSGWPASWPGECSNKQALLPLWPSPADCSSSPLPWRLWACKLSVEVRFQKSRKISMTCFSLSYLQKCLPLYLLKRPLKMFFFKKKKKSSTYKSIQLSLSSPDLGSYGVPKPKDTGLARRFLIWWHLLASHS